MSAEAHPNFGPTCPACGHQLHFHEIRKSKAWQDHDRGVWICRNDHCSRDEEVQWR